jgi:hypothetical protein
MATLNTYFPATSRRIRRILAVGALALASLFALAGLAPDGASANHTGTNPNGPDAMDARPPGFGCSYATEPPTRSTNADLTLRAQENAAEKDRAEVAVRCLVNHWRTDTQAAGQDRYRECAFPVRVPGTDPNARVPCVGTGNRVDRNRPPASSLRPLGHRSTLRLSARRHSEDMVTSPRFFSHCKEPHQDSIPCPVGYRAQDRVRAAGYCGSELFDPWGYRGENISTGFGPGTSWDPNGGSTPLSVVERWRDPEWVSAKHRSTYPRNGHWENILTTTANEHGVGVTLWGLSQDANGVWQGPSIQGATYTQDFGLSGPCPV